MLGHFYFSKRKDSFLLTNDIGEYSFVSVQDFSELISDKMPTDSPKWKELAEKKFCYEGSEEGFIRDNENFIREANRYLLDSTNLFIFVVTNKCNNQCVYCQANGGREGCNMQETVALRALQLIAKSPSKFLTIEFQGGEPLLNFPVIKYIVVEARKILVHKTVHFTLVSNLSLLTDEMASFFKENHVSISTSLDGPAFVHDANRPAANGKSSFLSMLHGKEILDRFGIACGAIQTTTALSLQHPNEIVDAYLEQGFDKLFIRPLTQLGAAARRWDEIGYLPEDFVSFYKCVLNSIIQYNLRGIKVMEQFAAFFLAKILRGRAANYMELRSPCGAGLGQMAITANGNIYTCDEGRMMAEAADESFKIGDAFHSDYDDCIESPNCKAVCSASLLETIPMCCDCVYKPYCGMCPILNYAVKGSIASIHRDRCKIHRGILDLLFSYLHEGNPEILQIFDEWSMQV